MSTAWGGGWSWLGSVQWRWVGGEREGGVGCLEVVGGDGWVISVEVEGMWLGGFSGSRWGGWGFQWRWVAWFWGFSGGWGGVSLNRLTLLGMT